MAYPQTRIESLSILMDPAGQDYLQELYGAVIENVQKGTISDMLKNRQLSGDPISGSVEAKRFANSISATYGTARAAGKGEFMKALPVPVQINRNREIVEEIEYKDTITYGVNGLLERRARDHEKTLVRELERAFFQEAADEGTVFTTSATNPNEIIEDFIQAIETTKNDYVDGVDRDMMTIIMRPSEYGIIRNALDTSVNNSNITTAPESFNTFHGVRVLSSVYLPNDVKMINMVDGSVALPIRAKPYFAEKIPLSEAYAVSLFFYFGVKAVTPDLIQVIK